MSLGDGGLSSHAVPLGDEPLFVEGVDVPLVRFQAGVRLDPPALLSRAGEHEHALVITNPWPTAVNGRYFIVEPGGRGSGSSAGRVAAVDRTWDIAPRSGSFSIAPGQTERVPLSISFSPAEESGRKQFVIDVEFSGRAEPRAVRVVRDVELGVPDVRLDVTASVVRAGGEAGGGVGGVVVEARVSTTRATPITAELFVRAPGFPREQRVISDLAPGETAVRLFSYRDGVEKLAGRTVHVALSLPDGGGRLSKSVRVGLPEEAAPAGGQTPSTNSQ